MTWRGALLYHPDTVVCSDTSQIWDVALSPCKETVRVKLLRSLEDHRGGWWRCGRVCEKVRVDGDVFWLTVIHHVEIPVRIEHGHLARVATLSKKTGPRCRRCSYTLVLWHCVELVNRYVSSQFVNLWKATPQKRACVQYARLWLR